ncbi:metallophosphatase family protein [Pseudoclavibacter alba]|uniref:metallophosphoesterase n=1 Tax=Pseudoclavibacter albus TaxID=272241 RepID=UPI0019D31358|nr:metallophosphatase family protein [Pseudoclavibacter alba]
MNIDQLAPQRLAIAGDWHGRLEFAADAVRHAKQAGADAIIHLGDFGYQFEFSYLYTLGLVLGDTPLFFIDGNHENFDVLLQHPLAADGTRPLTSHITHLPRGFSWQWHGHRWLALGGAHSVDREQRETGVSWWPEERITREDIERASSMGAVEVMLSHDSPAGVDTPSSYPPGTFPAEDEAIAAEHRTRVREVVDAVKPSILFHGHFHTRYEALLNGARVIGLAHDRSTFTENLILLDAVTLETAELPEH